MNPLAFPREPPYLPVMPSPEPIEDAPPRRAELRWVWGVEAVKAALQQAGTPPRLDIQGMLNAAFAVDGPALTAMVFEVVIGDRVRELDAAPYLLDTRMIGTVECSGQFLLMLLSGRIDLLRPRVVSGTPPDE